MAVTRTLTIVLDPRGHAQALRSPTWALKVLKGRHKGAAVSFTTETEATIGHAAGSNLVLEQDPTVSAFHCKILSDLEGFRVMDLGAKNGVWLGGRRIKDAWLTHNDEFTVGRSVIQFRVGKDDIERPLSEQDTFGPLLGATWPMRALYRDLAKAANSDASVLLEGESGTGKELAFEALVNQSPRKNAHIEVLDCAGLSPSLAEAELFGHEAGAFTGAAGARPGVFERATGGTLLLDHVSELPESIQPRLLGVLERKSVQRIGGSKRIDVDVRVVATTAKPLEVEINRGRFRADLYYRLAAIHLRLPPLRERREDIPRLVARFLSELPAPMPLPPDVLEQLLTKDYPGNVRELRNVVERYALGLDAPVPVPVPTPAPSLATAAEASPDFKTPYRVQKEQLLAQFERGYLTRLLDVSGGNITEAAKRSGIHRVHLHEMIRRLGLKKR